VEPIQALVNQGWKPLLSPGGESFAYWRYSHKNPIGSTRWVIAPARKPNGWRMRALIADLTTGHRYPRTVYNVVFASAEAASAAFLLTPEDVKRDPRKVQRDPVEARTGQGQP
jgi:hypothetical protein